MRLSTNKKLTGNGIGLQNFGALLIAHLEAYGVKLVDQNQKSDIHLIIIYGNQKSGAKNVLRLDGVYYDSSRLTMNSPIKRTLKQADGVVYQSKWCKIFAETMLNAKPSRSTVIYNGTDQIKFKKVSQSKFDKVFISCAYWRENKRLKSIVNSFLEASRRSKDNLGLYIVGKADYIKKADNILYFGKVSKRELFKLYSSSDYMCHICHLDACPNVVVEGLSSGLPVLCNNIGGTPELVKDDGIILDLDAPFDFKAIKNMKKVGSKIVNSETLTQGMLNMTMKEWSVSRPDLDISVSALKYYEFFKSLLC